MVQGTKLDFAPTASVKVTLFDTSDLLNGQLNLITCNGTRPKFELDPKTYNLFTKKDYRCNRSVLSGR